MRNLNSKIASTVAAIMAMASILSGCKVSEEAQSVHTPTHTCVILSNGYNMPYIDNVSDYIDTPADGDSVTIIVSDGKPASITYNFTSEVQNETAKAEESRRWQYTLSAEVLDFRPDDEESDLLSALLLASKDLRYTDALHKKLVLLTNGLSTKTLDMTTAEFWNSNPNSVLETIEASGYVSADNFENVDVTWHFVAATDGQHQQALSPLQEQFLVDFWQAYFASAGATVEINNEPLSGKAAEDVPKIKAIPVINNDFTLESTEPSITTPVISLPTEKLEFQPNSTDYRNEAAAALVLDDVSNKMFATSSTSSGFVIVGSTAKLSESSNTETALTLSENRAEKIKKELINRGFSSERLTAVGVGSAKTSLRSQNEEENRAVYIIDNNSELSAEVMAVYDNLSQR